MINLSPFRNCTDILTALYLLVQDQRRLGALIVPNRDEALRLAKELSIVDGNATELSKDNLITLLYEELRKW